MRTRVASNASLYAKERTILAIETSCDETAAAVLAFTRARNNKPSSINYKLLSNVVSSQAKLHAKYGGVVPMLAAREQQKNIEPVLGEALRAAGRVLQDIDYFAVTRGPGLIPSLHVGVNYARAIAFAMQKPLLGINHIEGHIYSNWLQSKAISFPILNLVVSGGHTELILMRGHGKYEIIGESRDDAAGEAFDKVAKLLGLGYPGGPIVSRLAEKGNPRAFNFPRPMYGAQNFDFSFSGLKTAVLYTAQKLFELPTKNQQLKAKSYKLKADLCASFEQAVVDVLVAKTVRAAKKHRARGVFLSGGVSANKKLRKELSERVMSELPGVIYRHPELAYTGDNAAMIAMAAMQQITHSRKQIARARLPEVRADANLKMG